MADFGLPVSDGTQANLQSGIPNPKLLLVVPPLIHPGALYHFEMAFVALLPFTLEIGNLQYPFDEVSKPDAVNFSFVKIIAEVFIQFLGNVFVIGPVNGRFKVSHSKFEV